MSSSFSRSICVVHAYFLFFLVPLKTNTNKALCAIWKMVQKDKAKYSTTIGYARFDHLRIDFSFSLFPSLTPTIFALLAIALHMLS